MNIQNKIKKCIALIPVCLVIIILIYTACKKQDSSDNPKVDPVIENARRWINNDIVGKERAMLMVSYSQLAKEDRVRALARMQKLASLLKWDQAKAYKQEGIQYVIVPVDQQLKPLRNKNYEAGRSVVIYRDQSFKMQLKIIEIISAKAGNLGSTVTDISSLAFANMILNKRKDIGTTNVSILFYNEQYHHLKSFRTKDGKWDNARIHLSIRKNATTQKRLASTMSQTVTCQKCTTWYSVGIWYDLNTGEIVSYEILDQWEECTDRFPFPTFGDGGEPAAPASCDEYCNNMLNDFSASSKVVSETVSVEVTPIDQLRKHKKMRWRILENITWSLFSLESGIVKLVDPQTNKWQWESLKHDKIEFDGSSYGGTVTHNEGTGTASFVDGTPNVLYAGMSVDFTVTYSPICYCDGINKIFPSRTDSHTGSAFWPAIP